MIFLMSQQAPNSREAAASVYRICGLPVVTSAPIEELSAFKATDLAEKTSLPAKASAFKGEGKAGPIIYQGPGWFGNQWRTVTCRQIQANYALQVESVGKFFLSADGEYLAVIDKAAEVSNRLIREVAMGPALILALALHDVWCLHASAARFEGRSVAFLGESGRGKSTLAAYLEAEGAAGWQLVADDILPITQRENQIEALPHFPQLKLPQEKQPARALPEHLPLEAVYLLHPAKAVSQPVQLRQPGLSEAALSLVRHTVASRLFSKDLLRRHLDFCARAVQVLAVRELEYPQKVEGLPEIMELINHDLATLHTQ